MKKLFASLLAATMVAGMAVSAFAADPTYVHYDKDYALTEKPVIEKQVLLNGDKLYYGIYKLDDNGTVDTQVTKASDADKLTVRLKDVRNGKYATANIKRIDPDGDPVKQVAVYKVTGIAKANEWKINDGTTDVTLTPSGGDPDVITKIAAEINASDEFKFVATVSDDVITLTAKKAESDAKITVTPGTSGLTFTADPDKAVAGKVNELKLGYYVEVKVDNYFDTVDDEIAFNLELRNNKGIQASTAELDENKQPSFTLGKAAEDVASPKKTAKVQFDKNEKEGPKSFDKDANEIIVSAATADATIEYTVKAAKQGDVYLGFDDGITKDIVVGNPEAELDFFAFPGNAEFDFTGTLRYYVADDTKEWYMYEIVDGKPVATNAKYNKEDSCFELRTSKLGKYVVSDKALVLGAEEKPADKPAEEKPATTDKVVGTGALA